MRIEKMEVEEKTLPVTDNSDENNPKKGKILTLLFPAESQPAEGKETKKDKNKPPTKVINAFFKRQSNSFDENPVTVDYYSFLRKVSLLMYTTQNCIHHYEIIQVVVRRLPPIFTKESFIEEFSPLPAHDYFHFVRGDLNLGTHAFSRAYINFLNQEDIFQFKEKYDDYDIQDDKGRTYHAVVEFAPFQKIPRRNIKKKLTKAGTLESDPKYIEFLKKLEEAKNFINNPSEYFHETESSASKAKIVTTPLLEFLKSKKQKKIDLKNETRQRKREAEREKKRKEEEKRKADRERERRKEEKKNSERNKIIMEKGKKLEDRVKKNDERTRLKDDKKETKNWKNPENDAEEQSESVIPNDPAILKVVVRQSDKDMKSGAKSVSGSNEETKSFKSNESETNLGKPERKYSDFRTRIAEEKQRKVFYKRDPENKTNAGNRKGVPDEKGDNCSIGNISEVRDSPSRKLDADPETRRHDYNKVETKSKFRYSEQRNRDREYRQKTSDCKIPKESSTESGMDRNKVKESERKGTTRVSSLSEEEVKGASRKGDAVKNSSNTKAEMEEVSVPSRRKSLEMEREVVDMERKRSKSFHDISSKEFSGFRPDKKMLERRESNKTRDTPENDSVQTDDNSKESTESDKMDDDSKRDPRMERRIRNKDRPSIEIYRPGMGKFSKQRLEQKKDETNCTGRNPYSNSNSGGNNKSNRFANKTTNRKSTSESKNLYKSEDCKNNGANGKTDSEVRTMTFTRSASKEN